MNKIFFNYVSLEVGNHIFLFSFDKAAGSTAPWVVAKKKKGKQVTI
jgi:hypothetical protein